jgi:predicted TIM-barrel fold metal-dependent hydrolase
MKYDIIDADGHISETWEQMRTYLDAPYRNRPTNFPYFPQDGWDRRLRGTLGNVADSGQAWIDALDRGGMAISVLYTTLGLFMPFTRDPEWAVALTKAYNTLLYEEFVKVNPARLKGVALLAPHDVDAAVLELRRCVTQYGFVGAMLPADGYYLLGHRRFDPIYAEAQRLDVPIAFHASGTDITMSGGHEPFPKFIQAHTMSHISGQMRQMVSTIFDGVPARFPNLRLAYLEAGCGWLPYFVQRMDEEFEKRGHIEAPTLTKLPSEYIKGGSIYLSCEGDEILLPQAIDYLGADYIVYASDFPHWDHSYPKSLKEIGDRADVSGEAKKKIFWDNPRTLYRLK